MDSTLRILFSRSKTLIDEKTHHRRFFVFSTVVFMSIDTIKKIWNVLNEEFDKSNRMVYPFGWSFFPKELDTIQFEIHRLFNDQNLLPNKKVQVEFFISFGTKISFFSSFRCQIIRTRSLSSIRRDCRFDQRLKRSIRCDLWCHRHLRTNQW